MRRATRNISPPRASASGVQPINVHADQARTLLNAGVTQMRMLRRAMADRIEPGALLWLREPFAFGAWADRFAPSSALLTAPSLQQSAAVHFLADGPKPAGCGITRFARMLPRACSRAFLTVQAVENAPLQRWSAQDEAALGCSVGQYAHSWNHAANAIATFGGNPDGMRWSENPTVRIITFRLVRQNIDAWLECQREAVAHLKPAAAVPETAAAGSAVPDKPVRRCASLATNAHGHERT